MPQYRYRVQLQLFAQEKTEPATPKKRQEAREKGQVAKSQDITASLLMVATFTLLLMYGSVMKAQALTLFRELFTHHLTMNMTTANVLHLFNQLILQGFLLLAPLLLVALAIGILGNYMQIGFLFSTKAIAMKFSKLNPIQGFKNIFGTRAIAEFLKSMLKFIVVSVIVYLTLWGERAQIMALGSSPLEVILEYVTELVLWLGIKIAAILIILSIADYFYQRYEYEKSLRMSKQDIKDEYKKSEGDPLIKSKIKEKQRRMALQRMMQEVPKADVVITNPTHFAVAIQYEPGKMEAPVVIAKGADYIALKMKQVAKDHGITMMENKPLARALYAQVEIGQEIPQELFQAVAEVLAYVYRLKGRKAARS